MQNTMRQSLVKDRQQPCTASSVTTCPEAGLRQKVKGIIRFVLQGRWRTAEVVALVDTGQTLPYDGIISKAAWETIQQPELDPEQGAVGTAQEGGVLCKRGVVSQRVRMALMLGNKQVEFRPLVLDGLTHSMNLGARFLEKHGLNVETTKLRLYSEEHQWNVPFTTRKDHIALTNTRMVFNQAANKICSLDGSRELGWGQLTPNLDKEEFTPAEWEYLRKESLGFPISTSKQVCIPGKTGMMVRVKLPPGVQPQDQWVVEPLNEDDEWGVPLGVVQANHNSDGRVLAVYVYNSTEDSVEINPGIPVGRALRAGVLPKGHPGVGECSALNSPPVRESSQRARQIWEELELEDNVILDHHPEIKEEMRNLVEEFQSIFTSDGVRVGHTQTVEHDIVLTTGAKVHRDKARPLHPQTREALKEQIEAWLADDVIQPSCSEWASAMVPVKKKDGSWRWAVDYRGLNGVTVPDMFPTPNISQILERLGGSKVFSSLDAAQAYHNVSLTPRARPLTAFITYLGLYEFKRMPFGLKNAGATYSRLAQKVKDGIQEEGVEAYLDDVLCHSRDAGGHLKVLRRIFQAHKEHGIVLKAKKTKLFQQQVDFLGFTVSGAGISMKDQYLEQIVALKENLPSTPKELSSRLGFMGYYSQFVPRYAELTSSLTPWKNKRQLVWSDGMKADWAALVDEFSRANQRCFLRVDSSSNTYPYLMLSLDFSAKAMAAVLTQGVDQEDRKGRLIAAKSRKCKPYEQNYHSAKGELAALVYGVEKFRHILIGQPFVVYTDNNAVVHWRTMKDDSKTHQRWFAKLEEFNFEVRHRKGKENIGPDALSRDPVLADPPPSEDSGTTTGVRVGAVWEDEVSPQEMQFWRRDVRRFIAELTMTDPLLSKVVRWAQNGRYPARSTVPEGVLTKLYDKAYKKQLVLIRHPSGDPDLPMALMVADGGKNKLVLPEAAAQELIQRAHRLTGHGGVDKTRAVLKELFWKPGLAKDIADTLDMCIPCKQRKKPSLQDGEYVPILSARSPGEMVYMDLMSISVMGKEGERYVLSILDSFTRYVQLHPIKDKKMSTVSDVLVNHWISEMGNPDTVVTDQGKEFTGDVFQKTLKSRGINHKLIPAGEKQQNIVERLHGTIWTILRAIRAEGKEEDRLWPRWVKTAQLAYNARVHRSTQQTPAVAMRGWNPKLTLGLSDPWKPTDLTIHQERLFNIWKAMAKAEDQRVQVGGNAYRDKPHGLKVGDLVMRWRGIDPTVACKKLGLMWLGPYKVTEILNECMAVIIDPHHPHRRARRVHVTKLQKLDHQGPGLPPEIPMPGAKQGDDEADDADSRITIFLDEHEVPPPKFLEGVWQWPEESLAAPQSEERRHSGPEDDIEWQRTRHGLERGMEPAQGRKKHRKPRYKEPLPVLAPQARKVHPEVKVYPNHQPEVEPPVEKPTPRVPQPRTPETQRRSRVRDQIKEMERSDYVPMTPPVHQSPPVSVPVSTRPVQGVKRPHTATTPNPSTVQPSPVPPPAPRTPSRDVPSQYILPPLPESPRSTRSESPCESTDWDMMSENSHQSKWSVQASRIVKRSAPHSSDVPMYPVQRRKRGRPRKERKPLGCRYNQSLPPAPVSHGTRSRSTRCSVVSSVPAESELESVPSSTDNLEPGTDFLTYKPAQTKSVSSKELMPPPRGPVKRRLGSLPGTNQSSVQPPRVPTKRRMAKPPSTYSQETSGSEYTSPSRSSVSSAGTSCMQQEPQYTGARGEKRVHTKVPKATWEYNLNARRKSSSSVTPKRAKPGRGTSTYQGSVEQLVPNQNVPVLISTKRFLARAADSTKLERGTTTRVWVDLELQGRRYQPGDDDLLVADLTSGWMRRSLIGQGLKREVDSTGERRWCLFVYQPVGGNVDHLPANTVIAKVTSQCLEANWPPLPAPRRSENTYESNQKYQNKKKNR